MRGLNGYALVLVVVGFYKVPKYNNLQRTHNSKGLIEVSF